MDVVLIDDHEAMRDALRELLERRGIRTVGTAGTVAEGMEVVAATHPEVAVVDVQLPDQSGLRFTRRIGEQFPDVKVMVYTGLEDVGTLAEAMESGAMGFALKVGGLTKLIQGLRLVARGQRYVDPDISAMLGPAPEGAGPALTKRERQVFELLAEGLTGEEIAPRLGVSPETVRTHIRNGMRKLEARTRAGAVAAAIRANEIEP